MVNGRRIRRSTTTQEEEEEKENASPGIEVNVHPPKEVKIDRKSVV